MLKGKTALITGGARGIGAAVAKNLSQHGISGLAIIDINEVALQEISHVISRNTECKCIGIKADVADEAQVINAYSIFQKEFGALDVLVNNAGICKVISIDAISMNEWDRTMNINLKGTFLFSREAMKIMKAKQGGRIINIASQAGKIGGLVAGPDYSASKAGILCLTKTFAKAGAPFNILVNSIAPGLIDTEMTQTFGYDKSMVPLGRIGTAEEISDVVLFLASDMSRYITGACIDVNGGMTMW